MLELHCKVIDTVCLDVIFADHMIHKRYEIVLFTFMAHFMTLRNLKNPKFAENWENCDF